LRYVELFAGIGGFRVGLENATDCASSQVGVSRPPRLRQETSGRFDCVFANENDKYARSVYRCHFGDIDGRDIRDVPPGDIPDADLWTFGAPCQDFSVAGRRAGLEGDRGNLFLYTLDLIAEKRPRYFLAENVPGLLSIDGGKAFANIIGQIAQMGYDCQWVCLNSKDFGVPQNRERLFVVGHLGGERRPEILSFGSAARDSEQLYGARIMWRDSFRQKYIESEIAAPVRTCETLRNQLVSGIRRLTPLETERLQAFPDNWTAKGIDDNGNEVEISDTQRYKMCGNAVTTSVIAHFARALIRASGVER